jgi:tryptophan 7-halogenase
VENTAAAIKKILIVGGGIVGWMAAAYLNRMIGGLGCTISVLESIKLETSAVGEASDPALVRFLRDLRIDEARFMVATSATFQLGTHFLDWSADSFWHAFGLCGGTINNIELFHYWLRSIRAGRQEAPYTSYSLQALLAQQGKSPRTAQPGPSPIVERGEYAFHLDTTAGADFLRELAVAEGVHQLFDDVRDVVCVGERIENVKTRSGRSLSADLYLDCTSEGLLVEKGLGDPWISWSELFLCDRVVMLPLPRNPALPPHVRLTALSAGWMSEVPLIHRVAGSYVYASALLSEDAALRELLARASPERACTTEPRRARLRPGRRTSFWVGNCVALGPAAGSIESLEAVDQLLVQRELALLVELFPSPSPSLPPGGDASGRTGEGVLRRCFNERIAVNHDMVRDFLLLHYALSRRAAEPFWRDQRQVALPRTLEDLIALHDENGWIAPEMQRLIPESSYHQIFAGNNRMPRRESAIAAALSFDRVESIMAQMRSQNERWVNKLPDHRELMEKLHRPPV